MEADTSDINRTIVTPRYGVAQVVFDTTADGQLEGVLLFNGEPMSFGVLEFEDGQTGWVGETGRLCIQGVSKPGVYEAIGQTDRTKNYAEWFSLELLFVLKKRSVCN